MHHTDLYHRIPTLPTDTLETLQRAYDKDPPPSDRRGYVSKMYYRITLELDRRKETEHEHMDYQNP